MESNQRDGWSELKKRSDVCVSDLARAISAVDRFNPTYFLVLALILLVQIGIVATLLSDDRLGLLGHSIGFVSILIAALASALSLHEARTYMRRWNRAKTGLQRSLHEAEGLAALGFVSTDKLDPKADDEVKQKLLALRNAVRDARERLGLKD